MLNEGAVDDAIRHGLAAVSAAPDDAEAHSILGAAFAREGDFARAIPEFEAAVRFDPKMLQAQGNLMAAYASLGRSDEAIATAEKALALARASGDTVFEQQILSFVKSYRNGATESP